MQGLPRKELAPIHSVKSGTLQSSCSTRPRVAADLGKSSSYAHRQVDEQPCNRSKKKDDKSAVAMLKKHELHGRTGKSVVCRDTRHEPNHGHIVCNSSIHDNLVASFRIWSRRSFSSIVTEELRHAETNPTCEIHESCCTSHQNSRPKSFARIDLPGEPHQRSPQRSKIWGSVSGGDRVARATCSWSSVEAGQMCPTMKGEKKEQHSSHLRKIGACLRQLLNLRNENLFWTPERRCIWSASRTWMMLKWILWRSRVVLR